MGWQQTSLKAPCCPQSLPCLHQPQAALGWRLNQHRYPPLVLSSICEAWKCQVQVVGEQDQSCAVAVMLQKEWLVFLSYKCVKKGRKKNSLISPESIPVSLYGLLLCRRILTEASCCTPKPKHFAVIYSPGWPQKQDLDRNVDGFSAGTLLEPMCIPAASSWAGCEQEILACPCFLLLHPQPLTSPLHHSEAQKVPVQTHKKFLQFFEGFKHPPPSRRKTQLK